MPALLSLEGRTFGRLRVLSQAPRIGRRTAWRCICNCGKEKVTAGTSLVSGKTTSCGCFHTEIISAIGKRAKRHGMRHSPEYKAWSSMRDRCLNPRYHHYHLWGGRGITICERWGIFENFFADMGARPAKGQSLDRIDNSKGYYPENCRWATAKQQGRNTRVNLVIEAFGKRMLQCEWVEILGITKGMIQQARRRGESLEALMERRGLGLQQAQ